MTTYHIESSAGQYLGDYPGHTPLDALDALARDAGYADHAASCAVTGDDPDSWTSSRMAFRSGDLSLLVIPTHLLDEATP